MERMILGSTILFSPFGIDEALEGLAAAGYTRCEIGAVKGWFEHIDPDTISDAEIARIGTKLRDLGLEPVSLSGHAQLQTQEGSARFGRAIDIAEALGMAVVNTYTGDATTEAEREAYFANVADLCDRAAKAGLKIGMETESNMLPTAEAGVAILDRIGRPDTLGFNYDPGNVVCYAGADPLADLRFALPRLVHVHLKDKVGGKGVFDFPPPGDGELDLAAFVSVLDEAGYAGPISAEVEFGENGWPDFAACLAVARRSVANLRALGLAPDDV
ncbi:MAG: sugar phosphate isomerase/epimerase [Chloroflexia bacterium]|nr:sugar phosphate isomerase/epimerase [Chloroflexia bacterium]